MITTKTGAKKLEANDNWAKIVPNAQGQDSAHNDSVEAHDDAIESLCQTISGTTNNCGHTINSGEYFIANGGKYKATATIPVNGAWSGSAQAVSDNDLINALNNSLTNLDGKAAKFSDFGGTSFTLNTGSYGSALIFMMMQNVGGGIIAVNNYAGGIEAVRVVGHIYTTNFTVTSSNGILTFSSANSMTGRAIIYKA